MCDAIFKIRYVFINEKASFLTTHFNVANSRFTDNSIYSVFSEDVTKYEAIDQGVKTAMRLRLEEFKKNIG